MHGCLICFFSKGLPLVFACLQRGRWHRFDFTHSNSLGSSGRGARLCSVCESNLTGVLCHLLFAVSNGFTFFGKRLEALNAVLLPRYDPTVVLIATDAGDS